MKTALLVVAIKLGARGQGARCNLTQHFSIACELIRTARRKHNESHRKPPCAYCHSDALVAARLAASSQS